jgi:hypothetical protein
MRYDGPPTIRLARTILEEQRAERRAVNGRADVPPPGLAARRGGILTSSRRTRCRSVIWALFAFSLSWR